jgi:hypothetical protein
MKVDGNLTGISGKEITTKEELQWRKEQATALLGKQKTDNAVLDAWNAQYQKPKSHRRSS